MADSTRISGSGGVGLPAESASRLAPGIIHAKKTGASSGSDSSSGDVKITYGEPGATGKPRGGESRKARADYRAKTGDSSFQHGDPASNLNRVTGGQSPRDVKDHGK